MMELIHYQLSLILSRNLAAVVTAITSASGYSDLDFTVTAGTNALTLTYSASDGDVPLADVGFLTTETVAAVDANLTIDGVPIREHRYYFRFDRWGDTYFK